MQRNKIKKNLNFSCFFLIKSIMIIAPLQIFMFFLAKKFEEIINRELTSNQSLAFTVSLFAIALLLFEIYRVMIEVETKKFFIDTKKRLLIFSDLMPKLFFIIAFLFAYFAFSLFYFIILKFMGVFLQEAPVILIYLYTIMGTLFGFIIGIALLPKSWRSKFYDFFYSS